MINIDEIRLRLDMLSAVRMLCEIKVRGAHIDGDEKKQKIFMVECESSVIRGLGAFSSSEEADARLAELAPIFSEISEIVEDRVVKSITTLLAGK